MKGARQRARNELETQKWIAWHTAFLPYLKKYSKLQAFMGPDDGREPGQRQTPEQMIAAARAWHEHISKEKT